MVIEKDIKIILSESLSWEQLANKTVLITGTRGFIASWLVAIFSELGVKIIHGNREHFNINIPFYIDEKIDYIFHAASNASPHMFKKDPIGTTRPNVIGTYNLLDLARMKDAEFILFSTSGVYGWNRSEQYPLNENSFGSLDCAKVENCYLESKRMAENLCMLYNHQYGVPVKILRLGICYGYGLKLDDSRVMNKFINSALNSLPINVFNGHLRRSFMYITDVITAIFYILFHGYSKPYNIAADVEISIDGLAQIFHELFNIEIIKQKTNQDRLSVDLFQTWMNTSRLHDLGWWQKVPLIEGIQRTVQAYKENGNIK